MFVDEIHRFNKAQQDAFLPHVEKGTVTLIGATTENPSFEVISALLSRLRVYVLKRLSDEALAKIVENAASDTERGLGKLNLSWGEKAIDYLAGAADGVLCDDIGVAEDFDGPGADGNRDPLVCIGPTSALTHPMEACLGPERPLIAEGGARFSGVPGFRPPPRVRCSD